MNAIKTLALALGLAAAALGSAGTASACDGANCVGTGESMSVFDGKPRPPEIELGPQAFVAPSTDRPAAPDAGSPADTAPASAIAPPAAAPFALGKTN